MVTGWSGLAAALLTPSLRNKYYLTFSLFLILNGFIHDFYLTRRNFHPVALAYMNVRAALRVFPKAPRPEPHAGAEPDQP